MKIAVRATDRGCTVNERQVLAWLGLHRNVVGLRHAATTEEYHYLVLQYAAGGDLRTYLHQHRPLPEKEVKYIFKQLLRGVQVSDIAHS